MRVVAAMSGGVDSAVAAARMLDAGHDVVGVHLALSQSAATLRESARGCCTIEDAGDARRVADVLGIPFYVWDMAERFKRDVIEDFTSEYALESAALFNPSMVWHPDQSGLPVGSRRFIVSLRATGEGHISSITFRSGVIDAECRIRIDEPTRYVQAPELVPNALYEKTLFHRKLSELGINGPLTDQVMAALGDQFTLADLDRTLKNVLKSHRTRARDARRRTRGTPAGTCRPR